MFPLQEFVMLQVVQLCSKNIFDIFVFLLAPAENNLAVIDLSCSVQLCFRRQHLYWTARVLVNLLEHQVHQLYVIAVWELNEGPSTVVA